MLFYAVVPPPEVISEIESVQDEAPVWWSKRKKPTKFHITLRHKPTKKVLGGDAAAEAAERFEPFDVYLDTFGIFPRFEGIPVFWVGPETPGPLYDLGRALGAYKSFRPHLTLGYGSPIGTPPAIKPIRWRVDGFALLETTDGPEYRVVKEYQL